MSRVRPPSSAQKKSRFQCDFFSWCRLSSAVECFLGKEEVTGSSPVVGSRFSRIYFGIFFCPKLKHHKRKTESNRRVGSRQKIEYHKNKISYPQTHTEVWQNIKTEYYSLLMKTKSEQASGWLFMEVPVRWRLHDVDPTFHHRNV